MKKSYKAICVCVSLFLSCVSSIPFSSVAMISELTTRSAGYCIIDSDKQPLKDAIRFYFNIVEAQQLFENNDLESSSKALYSNFVFNYLYFHLLHLNFQKVAEKFRDPNSELLYRRTLSYLVCSYKILEDLKNKFSTLEKTSAKYGSELKQTTVINPKKFVSGMSEALKSVISNENIVNYTNQIIETYNTYNNNLNKNWPLL